MWSLDGATIVAIIVAVFGLARYFLDRHDKRMAAAADTATEAQREAMLNKDKEIDGWKQRYEQERQDHRADTQRYEARIAHLEDLLFDQRDRVS